MSEIKGFKLSNGTNYEFKDETARNDIKELSDKLVSVSEEIVNAKKSGEASDSVHFEDDGTDPDPITAANIKIVDEENFYKSDTVEGALQEVFLSASEGKNVIASAITGMGVDASDTDTFAGLAEKIKKISGGGSGGNESGGGSVSDGYTVVEGEITIESTDVGIANIDIRLPWLPTIFMMEAALIDDAYADKNATLAWVITNLFTDFKAGNRIANGTNIALTTSNALFYGTTLSNKDSAGSWTSGALTLTGFRADANGIFARVYRQNTSNMIYGGTYKWIAVKSDTLESFGGGN